MLFLQTRMEHVYKDAEPQNIAGDAYFTSKGLNSALDMFFGGAGNDFVFMGVGTGDPPTEESETLNNEVIGGGYHRVDMTTTEGMITYTYSPEGQEKSIILQGLFDVSNIINTEIITEIAIFDSDGNCALVVEIEPTEKSGEIPVMFQISIGISQNSEVLAD